MACNCGKRNPDGTRPIRAGAPIPQPPLGQMRFYAVSPDGTEESFSTLRAARDHARLSPGNGWKVEGRREED